MGGGYAPVHRYVGTGHAREERDHSGVFLRFADPA